MQIDEKTIEFIAQGTIFPEQELEIMVSFPSTILNIPASEKYQSSSSNLLWWIIVLPANHSEVEAIHDHHVAFSSSDP